MYRNYRTLNDEELQELEMLYPTTPNRLLSRQFSISVDALMDYVAKPRGWKKDRKATQIGNRGGRSLTEKETQWIIRHYKHTKNDDIMAKFGIGESTLHRLARKHGLRKSRQQMKKTQLAATDAAYEACRRYGIYEETARRMREKMLAMSARGEHIPGSFVSGVTNLMRLGPKRNRERIEKAAQTRKETIRKEMRRVLYGLERKTKLRCIVLCKYTRRQTSHRYNALKRGYIIMEDCSEQSGERYNIYYDDQTERAPIFENNLKKDGFCLKRWDLTNYSQINQDNYD